MRKDSDDYVRITMGHVVFAVAALLWVGYQVYLMFQAQQAGRGGEAIGTSLGGAIGILVVLMAFVGWNLFQIFVKGKKVQFGTRSTSKSSLPGKVDLPSGQFDDLDV